MADTGTRQYNKPGGMAAGRILDRLRPDDVRPIGPGARAGDLPDGGTVNVRPNGTRGDPTLDVYRGGRSPGSGIRLEAAPTMTPAVPDPPPPPLPDPAAARLPAEEAARLLAGAEARWVTRPTGRGGMPCFRPEALAARGWVVAPLEDELVEGQAEQFAAARARWGFASAWAVELPWTDTPPSAFVGVPLTESALTNLRHDTLIGSGHLMVEEARAAFAVVTDGDYYWTLGGPQAFVEDAVGMALGEALARFGGMAARYARPPTERGLALTRIHALAAEAAGGGAPPAAPLGPVSV